MNKPRVAIVYDRATSVGGAERVLQVLHNIYPNAPLYTSVHNVQRAPWTKGWTVHTSFLQHLPFSQHHELLGLLMPLAFEHFDFSSYDLVISVTSEAAKGIITKPGTRHVCYLLTPTRYLWSHARRYEKDFYQGWKRLLVPLHKLAQWYLRWWDEIASQRPDIIISISKQVARRCLQYYHRESIVLYPPIDVQKLQQKTEQYLSLPAQHFYLCVARLVPYKRIDLAISACMQLQRHLVIIGKGSDEKRLRKLAYSSPYIHFYGHLTDEQLVAYYQQCTAFLSPGEEDFGITVAEALSAGKPVITHQNSGNAELIDQGKTGIFIAQESLEEVIRAITKLEAIQWNAQEIRRSVLQYNVLAFIRRWKEIL